LREPISSAFHAPFRSTPPSPAIYALKDVFFQLKKGEVHGLSGLNGAGKSTLLKILSRITEPTHGFVDLQGRFGSLLQVGTGFSS
jgi:lipopolysaccharide transport system ATP-binding protein